MLFVQNYDGDIFPITEKSYFKIQGTANYSTFEIRYILTFDGAGGRRTEHRMMQNKDRYVLQHELDKLAIFIRNASPHAHHVFSFPRTS